MNGAVDGSRKRWNQPPLAAGASCARAASGQASADAGDWDVPSVPPVRTWVDPSMPGAF
jgi:hypothetical protein